MNDRSFCVTSWFIDHEDGEFVRLRDSHPYSITPLRLAATQVLYSTKPPYVLRALNESLDVVQVIGRAGLPSEADIAWLQSMLGGNAGFLGDADLPDLMIFAWLRAHLPIRHIGVSDRFLASLELRANDLPTIPMTASEVAGWELLDKVCPDFENLLGVDCAAVLADRRKLEMEAVFCHSDLNSQLLHDALTDHR